MPSDNIKRQLNLPKDHSFFLFGPRQVGKTTLIKKNFDSASCLVYDLLIPEEYRRLVQNPGRFRDEVINREKKITHVFIDEVQKLPSIMDEVHYLMENIKDPPKFILSGSSARKLKRSNANMLGGRAYQFFLSTLTYQEIIGEKGEESFSLFKALELGTLPAVYLATRESAILTLQSYVNTYIKEEVQIEALVRNLNVFVEFLRLSAESNGQIINYSNLASDLGLSSSTIKEYYQILEDTLLGFMLRPFSKKIKRKISKHPKFYFFDTGVCRALNKELSVELSPKTKKFGSVFEHFIIKEFVNLKNYINPEYELSFYRTENNAEVDLVINSPHGEVYAIEIKASDSPSKSELRGLISLKEVCPEAILLCASLSPKQYMIDEILVCPWQNIFDKVFTN